MKQVITINNGAIESIVEDGKNVYTGGGAAGSTATQRGPIPGPGAPSTGGTGVAPGFGTAQENRAANNAAGGALPAGHSELAEMLARHPTSLNWRYASHSDLVSDIVAKAFKTHRVELRKKDGSTSRLVQGTVAADATPVRYIEQSDGSVIYETYLDNINEQGNGKRTDILPAYNDRAEMLNDLDAIKFQQIVELDGVRVWPPANQAGFGPALPYTTGSNGGIVSGLDGDGSIRIEKFE